MSTPVVEISRNMISEFIIAFNQTDFTKIDYSKYAVVDFIGFDAYAVVKSLMKKRDALKITSDELKDDIMWILAITLKKGSVTKNNKDKMHKDGIAQVDRLVQKYDMQFSAGKGSSPETITFTRVLAAFPVAALNMLVKIGPRTVSAGPFGSSVVPDFMQHQVFASIIPRQGNALLITFVKTLVLAYSCDVSSISSTSKTGVIKTEDLLKIANSQITFVNAAYLAAYPSEASRTTFCKNLEWTKIYNTRTKKLYDDMKTTYFKDLPDMDWLVVDAEGRTMFSGSKEEGAILP